MKQRNRKSPVLRNLAAACLALVLLGGGGGIAWQQTHAVASVVSLDVNPSVELRVNSREKVLICEALNPEAEAVLADMNGGADLKGTKLDVAVNAVVGALVRNGYLDSLSSAILISVEDGNQTRAARLEQQLTAEVDTMLQAQAAEAVVLSQTVRKDTAVEQQAREHHISTGKAALIAQITALNGSLSFEKLSALSAEELKDLLETRAPGMPIGRDSAAEIVRNYAGVMAEASVRWDVDAELDEKPAHYKVDLWTPAGEFEYEVEAYTGEVLRGKADVLAKEEKPVPAEKPEPQGNPASSVKPAVSGADTAAKPEDRIGEQRALELAAEDLYSRYPELRDSAVLRQRTELDRDDGRLHYDVELDLVNCEADYEIDAASGKILGRDVDYEKPAPAEKPAADSWIGEDRALSAALAHAGVAGSQAARVRVELDEDDGRMVYEIEFRAGEMEYEYTVDAADGAVLEHERERDD